MNLNELTNELTRSILGTPNIGNRTYEDFLQDTISEFLNKRAVELRSALFSSLMSPSPCVVKTHKMYSPLSQQVVQHQYSKAFHELLEVSQNEINKRIFGDFGKAATPIAKCECGAEKLGVMKHSDWCAKHSKDQ